MTSADVDPRVPQAADAENDQASGSKSSGPPQAAILKEIVKRSGHRPFRAPNGKAFVRFPRGTHVEVHEITPEGVYANVLQKSFNDATGTFVNPTILRAFIGEQRASAMLSDHCETVFMRLAPHPSEAGIVVDLADDEWRQVVVTKAGWCVVTTPVVAFRRTPYTVPLPDPVRGGRLDALRSVINVSDETWPLVVGFLLVTLSPWGPYPLLLLVAQQGSGKSFAASVLKRLIDPTRAPLRAPPRSEHDLLIAALGSWVLCFDNLSYISRTSADALCRMSTGGGFSTRKLFSDELEVVLEAKRPVIVTGIEEMITQADLLDRTLMVHLQPIAAHARATEAQLEANLESIQPSVLGALLDAVVVGLRRGPSVHLSELPRLADFALWVVACEPGTGLPPGSILEAMKRNEAQRARVALEADVLVEPLKELVAQHEEFRGTATEIITALELRCSPAVVGSKAWPRAANALSGRLRRLTPVMAHLGLSITSSVSKGVRTWTICRM